jgi:hypothetical protein
MVDMPAVVRADEERLIREVQRDVCAAFPGLPADHVGVVVECLWAAYDGARIRDFIPVLVRKQAREELREVFQAGVADPRYQARPLELTETGRSADAS